MKAYVRRHPHEAFSDSPSPDVTLASPNSHIAFQALLMALLPAYVMFSYSLHSPLPSTVSRVVARHCLAPSVTPSTIASHTEEAPRRIIGMGEWMNINA